MNAAALRLGWWAFWATALATGFWFAATAAYRWDDHGLLAQAWADGDLGAAIAHVWQMHTEVRAPEGWPKFYRPVYHAIYLADAFLAVGAAPCDVASRGAMPWVALPPEKPCGAVAGARRPGRFVRPPGERRGMLHDCMPYVLRV